MCGKHNQSNQSNCLYGTPSHPPQGCASCVIAPCGTLFSSPPETHDFLAIADEVEPRVVDVDTRSETSSKLAAVAVRLPKKKKRTKETSYALSELERWRQVLQRCCIVNPMMLIYLWRLICRQMSKPTSSILSRRMVSCRMVRWRYS